MCVSENMQKKLLEDFEKFEKEEIGVGKNEKSLKFSRSWKIYI
jgi:hypothetical protein